MNTFKIRSSESLCAHCISQGTKLIKTVFDVNIYEWLNIDVNLEFYNENTNHRRI